VACSVIVTAFGILRGIILLCIHTPLHDSYSASQGIRIHSVSWTQSFWVACSCIMNCDNGVIMGLIIYSFQKEITSTNTSTSADKSGGIWTKTSLTTSTVTSYWEWKICISSIVSSHHCKDYPLVHSQIPSTMCAIRNHSCCAVSIN